MTLPALKHINYPLGKKHPEPCPDCGARLFLVVRNERVFYRCEKDGCEGNAGAHPRDGRPLGFPINKEGRRLRGELHKLLDQWWKIPGFHQEERASLRREVYRYMQMHVDVPDFHVAMLNIEQLHQAKEIATTRLPMYMRYIGIEINQEAHNDTGYRDVRDHRDNSLQP